LDECKVRNKKNKKQKTRQNKTQVTSSSCIFFIYLFSYKLGLNLITTQMRRALGACTNPDLFFEKAMHRDNTLYHTTLLQRRKSSEAAAKAITRNGSITAAITRIGSSTNHAQHYHQTHSEHGFLELTEPSPRDISHSQ
jgi:alpha,alpha-trehalase